MPKTYDSLIRVSKMGGREESADTTMTIADQLDANEYAIRTAGGRVGKVFKALDQSGYSVTDSPAWREALARCQRGESNGIVVAYGDRLTRNWRKVGAYYDALEAANAEVIIAGMPGIDYRTPEGRAQTGMMAVMADMQWQAARARGDRIAEAVLRRGVPARVPYGYLRNERGGVKADPERDAKALVPDPERRQWVELIFRLRADRCSWVVMGERLAAAGAPTPGRGGDRWARSTLRNIIANRTYLGYVTLGKREPVASAHEPLVSEALWHAAQATDEETTISRTGLLVGGLALGLAVCEACGVPMSVTHAGHAREPMYGCKRRTSRGVCPHPTYIKKSPVDAWLDAWVVRGIEGLEPFDVFATARELTAAREAVDLAVQRRKQIVSTAAKWEPEDAKAAYDAAKADEIDARAHYDHLASRAADAADLPESADAWHALDLDAQRRVLRLLVARIDVAPPVSRSKFASPTARLKLVERGSGT